MAEWDGSTNRNSSSDCLLALAAEKPTDHPAPIRVASRGVRVLGQHWRRARTVTAPKRVHRFGPHRHNFLPTSTDEQQTALSPISTLGARSFSCTLPFSCSFCHSWLHLSRPERHPVQLCRNVALVSTPLIRHSFAFCNSCFSFRNFDIITTYLPRASLHTKLSVRRRILPIH